MQAYLTIGAFYRFSLNGWNSPTSSPFNFNTEDREYYMEAVLGVLFPFGAGHTLTVDLNNRDAFNSYNLDFPALDVALNLASGPNWTIRLLNSLRMTSFFMGTADIGQYTVMLGLNTWL